MMMNKTNETKVRNLVEGFLVQNDDIESFEEFMKELYKDPDMMIDNLNSIKRSIVIEEGG